MALRWRYIAGSHPPDLVIETGTFFSGSAPFIATVMDIIGHDRVTTINKEARPSRPVHPRISYSEWLKRR